MIKNCVFRRPVYSKEKMVEIFDLKLVLANERTAIYQNEEMRFCVDREVVRIMIFEGNNIKLLEKIRGYFYGEKYGIL